MLNFQDTFETRKRSFISPFLICLTVPLSQLLRKTNHEQKNLSYVAPCIWNKLQDFLKTTDNVNTHKYRYKKHHRRINNEKLMRN